MTISTTTIILIALFIVCGLVLIWAIKNGNGLKLKKKPKIKKDPNEKFKDVVPKEKQTGKPKEKPAKIRQAVKDEKAGKVAPLTNKVMKVTKEDFKSHDLNVPKSLEGETKFDDKTESKAVSLKPTIKSSIPSLEADDELWLKNKLKEFELPELDDKKEDFDELDKLLGSIQDFESPFATPMGGETDDIGFVQPSIKRKEGKILNETMETRFNQVFGKMSLEESSVKEVVVGDILSNNRSKVNREARMKRARWFK